eukprot:gene7854-12325_t
MNDGDSIIKELYRLNEYPRFYQLSIPKFLIESAKFLLLSIRVPGHMAKEKNSSTTKREKRQYDKGHDQKNRSKKLNYQNNYMMKKKQQNFHHDSAKNSQQKNKVNDTWYQKNRSEKLNYQRNYRNFKQIEKLKNNLKISEQKINLLEQDNFTATQKGLQGKMTIVDSRFTSCNGGDERCSRAG